MIPNFRLHSLSGSEHNDVKIVSVFENKLQGWKRSDQVAAGTLPKALRLQLRLATMLSNKYYTL